MEKSHRPSRQGTDTTLALSNAAPVLGYVGARDRVLSQVGCLTSNSALDLSAGNWSRCVRRSIQRRRRSALR